jgi:hypothetical protein
VKRAAQVRIARCRPGTSVRQDEAGGDAEREQPDCGSDPGVRGEQHREQHSDDDSTAGARLVKGHSRGDGDDHPAAVTNVSEDGEPTADERAVVEEVSGW